MKRCLVFSGPLSVFELICLGFCLMLTWTSYLYTLNINPLSDTSFAKSLLLFNRFHFFLMALQAVKLICLIKSYLFLIFAFVFIACGDKFKKLLKPMSKSLLPVFSSRSVKWFQVLRLGSFNPSEFIFIFGVEVFYFDAFTCCPVFLQ